jgi:hypothetical protein
MAEKAHIRGWKTGKFCGCAVSGGQCECGANFRYTNVPPWGNPYQAHHLLPVTCVQAALLEKHGIQGILKQTVWCINKKPNMRGMPVWGDTVEYYTKGSEKSWTQRLPPAFVNVPQHSYDHTAYNKEVKKELDKIVKDVKNAKHKADGVDIAGDLKGLSSDMKGKLKGRGKRMGGTHVAWLAAIDEKMTNTWFRPFSMAGSASKRSFPVKKRGAASWVEKMYKALNANS